MLRGCEWQNQECVDWREWKVDGGVWNFEFLAAVVGNHISNSVCLGVDICQGGIWHMPVFVRILEDQLLAVISLEFPFVLSQSNFHSAHFPLEWRRRDNILHKCHEVLWRTALIVDVESERKRVQLARWVIAGVVR